MTRWRRDDAGKLRRPAGAWPVALACLLLAACAGAPPPPQLALPATFRGDLPCADCTAIRHHLDLWPDRVYHLRREWLGTDVVRDELGRWRLDGSRNALVLGDEARPTLQFAVQGSGSLRLLDTAGRPIDSELPYELESQGTLEATDLELLLSGEMTYMADAARFTECLTGRAYPIAMEQDYPALERAYVSQVDPPGAPLHVTLEGRLTHRPRMEGGGQEATLVVRRFITMRPGRHCTP